MCKGKANSKIDINSKTHMLHQRVKQRELNNKGRSKQKHQNFFIYCIYFIFYFIFILYIFIIHLLDKITDKLNKPHAKVS